MSGKNTVSQETLKSFLEAFNRHDLDAIVNYPRLKSEACQSLVDQPKS